MKPKVNLLLDALGIEDRFQIPEKAKAMMKSPKRAYRGGNTYPDAPHDAIGENALWWTNMPDTSNTYNTLLGKGDKGGYSIGGVVDDADYLVVDAKGARYDEITPPWTPEQLQILREKLLAQGWDESHVEYALHNRSLETTDRIAQYAELLGYPGVRFDNVKDSILPSSTTPDSTVWKVNDRRTRRAQTARFEDPDSPDILAALGISLGGLGAAGAGLAGLAGMDESA